ncbi:MAG: hypothetical protein M1826_006629 [Phylliscum demangeonii]|nr:MAG: hypothetical protein M1826_006629 [Phylliscum demangeonii]
MIIVNERKNQLVWDALKYDNYKQALQLCNKRLKRGERGDYLPVGLPSLSCGLNDADHAQALKAHVLAHFPSGAQKLEGLAEAKSLAEKDPAVTDPEILSLLQKTFDILERQPRTEPNLDQAKDLSVLLWDRALKAAPEVEHLARKCFLSYLQRQDWRNAQKVGSLLSLFCNLNFLNHCVLPSPSRAIQTPQELHLLVSIYLRQDNKDGVLNLLGSSNLGVSSLIARGDWSFVRQKLNLLEEQQRWQDVWDFCYGFIDETSPLPAESTESSRLLSPAKKIDDWRIWQAFVAASVHVKDAE